MTLRTCRMCKARWTVTHPFGKNGKSRVNVIVGHDDKCAHRRKD